MILSLVAVLQALAIFWLGFRIWDLENRVVHHEYIMSRVETTLDGFNERTSK